MSQLPDEITALLDLATAGRPDASARVFDLLYGELHRMAGFIFRSQPAQHTLQPTALVHEAYIKMVGANQPPKWESRLHFMRVASRAMRHILVSHSRAKNAEKRGGADKGERVTLSIVADPAAHQVLDVIALHQALDRLQELDARQSEIAELRFFGGLKNQEVADALGVSLRTVELDWKMAKAWLAEQMKE